ncbi:MAG: hypothetical protein U9R03_01220 [Candidatus Aerophobetes bacterium]|nr:hypothetical protein [Candidatus Aerophobetes bacterium]
MINDMKRILVMSIIFLLSFGIKVFAEPSIFVDTSTGRITVKATRKQLEEIERMIPQFPVQTRQVQIKARIVEMSEEAAEEFGSYLTKLTGTKIPSGTEGEGIKLEYGPKTLAEVEGGKAQLLLDFSRLIAGEEKFNAILNMLISQGKAKVLSEPRVTTMSGEVAGMYVTSDIPYLSGYTIVDERQVPEYSYTTVGIVLQVWPRIVGENLIQMSVVPIVGDYETTAQFGAEHPIFKRQVAPTNITVSDGEPIIIGGLIQEKKERKENRLPVLSDLPVLGKLFTSYRDVKTTKNLLITVKPHIVTPREIKGRTKRIFTFKYALAEEIALQTRGILSSEGVMEVNSKEAPPNSILVRDNKDKIGIIQKMFNKMGAFEQQRRQKIFPLVFSSCEQAKETASLFLSPQGFIQIDKKANSITIEDGAYQLMRIEKALSSLEKHNQIPQRKVFHLKYAREEEIAPLLKEFLSPQGKIEIVEDSILVVDNNWVIQRIEKEIEKLDTFKRAKKEERICLKYMTVSRAVSLIEAMKSPQGKIKEKDEEKNELLLEDAPYPLQRIKKIIAQMDTFDNQKEERIYTLHSVKAEDIKKTLSIIQPILSEKGELECFKNKIIVIDSAYHQLQVKKAIEMINVLRQ